MSNASWNSIGRLLRAVLDSLKNLSITVLCVVLTLSVIRGFSPFQAPQPTRPTQIPRSGNGPLPTAPLSLNGADRRGVSPAKVVIVEYSDFQCPYCSRFAQQTLPLLDEQYIRTGKVQMAFRQLPLETLHPNALKASSIVKCAGAHGKFWEMQRVLFEAGGVMDDAALQRQALAVGLDGNVLKGCAAGEGIEQVRADIRSAQELGVASTPTFFIGVLGRDGRVERATRLTGAVPWERLRGEIERQLSGPA